MTEVPKSVRAYMAAIGRKGGRNGKGAAKKKAGALGGIASGKARAAKAALKKA
jgi:hypothetical protein